MIVFKLFLLILLFSCSHDKLIKQAHVSGSCSKKIKEIQPRYGQSLIDLSKQATTGTVSIAIAGVGAATDALVIIFTHPATKFTLCAATLAVALDGHVNDAQICNLVTDPYYNPKLAQKALDSTKSWRCPNLDYISQGLREVAKCYSDHNESDKAKLQLESILSNKTILPCISDSEIQLIKREISLL